LGIRYQIMNGTEVLEKGKAKTDESGKVTLPFTLPDKTSGDPFICKLTDTSGEWSKDIFLPSNIDPVEIKFFPEGGNLITGTPSKVGFTAFNKWGMPVDVEGSVIDQDGKLISMVKTFTNGVGLFSVHNSGNQKLKLVLSGKTGNNQSYELPAANDKGLALAVVKVDSEFITANLIFGDKQKHGISLVVNQGSTIYWAADMEINGMGRIKIPTDNLPQGINQLSVFSSDGKLLADRIVYTDRKQELKTEVLASKSSLKSGEKVNVTINLSNENGLAQAGSVCISVSDKNSMLSNKPHIDDCLLFDSELETPVSVLVESLKGKQSKSAMLEMFLIANRITGFDWERIIQFKPEAQSLSNAGKTGISGLVSDKNGNRMNKAKVSLVNNKSMQIHTTTTNADGRFSFPSLNTGSLDDYSAKATDPEGKNELQLVFNKNLEERISDFVAHSIRKYSLMEQEKFDGENYYKNNPDILTKAPKPVKTISNSYESQRKMLSTATSLLEVIKTIRPYKIQNNQIVFSGSENSINFQSGALIVLDGQQLGTDVSVINTISPNDVDHIFFSTNPMEIQRYTGLNSVGIIKIFSKKAAQPVSVRQSGAKINKYDGIYRIPNDFQEFSAKQKSINKTLLWIPEQKISETGKFEFTVTAGKVFSDFIIDVQGISVDGRAIFGLNRFSVVK